MIFPKVGSIATTSVVSIDINNKISDAMKKMFNSEHRNILVTDGKVFRVMRVTDILNMKARDIDMDSSLRDVELPMVPAVNKDRTVLNTLEYLNCEVEYICAVDDDGELFGLISHTDIISSIDPDTLMDNFCLLDFLNSAKEQNG